MTLSCQTSDGQTVYDGDEIELVRRAGWTRDASGQPVIAARSVKGIVRAFEQDGETHWEVVTGDAHYPAIGFTPGEFLIRSKE